MKRNNSKNIFAALTAVSAPVMVFALRCVSRINRKVRQYPFNPELPKPVPGVDLARDDHVTRLYIRWSNLLNNAQTALWKAPAGIVKKPLKVSGRDGYSIGGYILEPENCGNETLPVMLYCHGGAFFLTLMKVQLDIAAVYARKLRCRVVIPQYRTSLDHPYPVPVNDCYDTLKWIARSGTTDLSRVMISGDSAGGCLAAEVSLLCCDQKLLQPACQLLIYPVTDTAQDTRSLDSYAFATWTKAANSVMWKIYLACSRPGPQDYAVPMLRNDFSGIPRAYVEAAEMDTLCDQGIAYAQKLRAGGVDTTVRTVEGAYHGFDGDVTNPFVQKILDERIEWLRQVLAEAE